jgi:ribosome-associated protein
VAKAKKTLKKKSSPKKTIAKKASAKKPVSKKPVKKPVAKKTAPKKFPAKKAAKTVVKKTGPKNPIVKKVVTLKSPPGLPEQMLEAALKVLDERQAEDIVTVNLAGKSAMADYMIIASGRASKQLGAIAHYLREAFEKLGAGQMRIEGLSEGNWVLMDAGDIIVHLFRPEVRRYYNLEQIWDRSGRNSEISSRDED